MKITLITVCYNSAAVIRTALESVLAQKGVDCEYLVIDGGSTDGTVEILKAFEPRFRVTPSGSRLDYHWQSEPDKGMYDAINKGIRRATGEIIGILNADDVLATDDVLARIVPPFEGDSSLDGTYGDIRFVKDLSSSSGANASLDALRALPSRRYCSGRFFRPWMFRFGVQTAHPSTFFRKDCFARWGEYSLNYGMFGDFDLLLRFIWKNRARMRYLPFCTTVMRAGGASTNGLQATLAINRTDRKVIRDNGYWTCCLLLYSRYLFKVFGFILGRR